MAGDADRLAAEAQRIADLAHRHTSATADECEWLQPIILSALQQAQAPTCDCGTKITQCSSCAVADWQASHPDWPLLCCQHGEPSPPRPEIETPPCVDRNGHCLETTTRCKWCNYVAPPRERPESSRQQGAEPVLELFKKYGGHWWDCPAVTRVARAQLVEGDDGELETRRFVTRSDKPCECGLDAVLESLKSAGAPRERGEWAPIDENTPLDLRVYLARHDFVSIGTWGDFRVYNYPRFTHWRRIVLPAPPAPSADGRTE